MAIKTAMQMITEAKEKSQYISVTFVKVNGEDRTIVYNPKSKVGILGDKATEAGKQAVATRKANNPNLVSVFDSQLASKGTAPARCWRSINTDTVKKITYSGETYNF